MTAFDFFSNMYDVGLKPRLLRTLLKEQVPDDKHPFQGHSELTRVVSIVKTHGLLSESFIDSMDQNLIDLWKSTVYSWVQPALLLATSDMPDKCWVGISLLGLTCHECSSDRFLASYSGWFYKLLSFLQSPADSYFVTVASCASISDLFTRLGGFSNVKKDGTSLAGKLIQPVLKLLNDDSSEAVWEGVVDLLYTLVTLFPFSVHRHYDSVETDLALKVLSGKCSVSMLKKLAHCLALLPRSKGDGDSWFLMMQKILLSISDSLDDAFRGLEEEAKRNEAVKFLVRPGMDPTALSGGDTVSGKATYKPTKRSKQSLMSTVSTLMLVCATMLTSSYPFKVTAPVRSLLALVERVLMVNGSFPPTSLLFMTAMQQEIIYSDLPLLHSCSLELLTAIIKGVGSQLLPYAASVVRLITVYFKKCLMPELRIKIYSITRILLISMGVGMSLCLSEELIDNAFFDLSPGNERNGEYTSLNLIASTEALHKQSHRKRKYNSSAGSIEEQQRGSCLGVVANKNQSVTPISLRIAALESLEALLTVSGALTSENWQADVGDLLITTAVDSFQEGWATEQNNTFQPNEPSTILGDLQLAALRALLASFLSSSQVPPTYLYQGLELFCRGKHEIGTKLADFCSHALLVLELLIHRRSVALENFPYPVSNSFDEVNCKFPDTKYTVGMNRAAPFNSCLQGVRQDSPNSNNDKLYNSWLENDRASDVPVSNLKNAKFSEECPKVSREHTPDMLFIYGSSDTKIQEKRKQAPLVVGGQDKEKVIENEVMDDSHDLKSIVQSEEPMSCTVALVPAAMDDSVGMRAKVASDTSLLHHAGSQIESCKTGLLDNCDELASMRGETSTRTSNSEKSEAFPFKLDDEALSPDDEPLPDIIDADPDSENE
ncbi:Proline-, glutamic acid-and leucine-rich protein 1 [Quillaja saponaria]|uniref:Proline-, glutamic acid-and leucine-rich protein 1 n=1 Tax=Quillaja saponaria TaxID=32244 RepID=A0AAD7Q4W4_QUISA|nr:Proline-, glutamic acid-and leucine-rich protein 1 [Quillaja saponaria]